MSLSLSLPLSLSSLSGDVKLFDLRFGKVRWQTNVHNGVCGVEFDRKDIEVKRTMNNNTYNNNNRNNNDNDSDNQ